MGEHLKESSEVGIKTSINKASNDINKEYKVGYKKPPKQTQFKTGRSGNPKGRPKRSKNLVTLIEHELDKEVVVNEQGKRSVLSKREAIVKRLVNEAANGSQTAMRTLFNMTGSDPEIDPSEFIQSSDLRVVERLRERLLQEVSPS